MKKQLLVLLMSLLFTVNVFSQTSWSVTGNSETTTSNFIGTTNSVPLIFRTNNQWAGFTGFPGKNNVSFGYLSLTNAQGTGSANTALGAQSLQYCSSASGNVGLGTWALQWCTQGENNTAVGLSAMGNSLTVGNSNVAIGHTALFNNSGQSGNTAVGAASLYTNTGGSGLTAVGFKSLCNNSTGDFNTALGFQALLLNTTGFWNVALGSGSLQNNRVGRFNTAAGNSSMHFNTEGVENSAFGEQALGGNLDGSYNTAVGCRSLWSILYTPGVGDSGYGHGSANTAVGYEALKELTTGNYNVAIGVQAMYGNSTGINNIAIGCSALYANTTGSNNIAIGDQASGGSDTGSYNTVIGKNAYSDNSDGSYNTAIGYNAEIAPSQFTMSPGKITSTPIGGLSNSTAIGNGALANSNNQVKLGNSAVTSIGGAVPWSNFSDGRAKRNIHEDVPGLAFINKLQPVTYTVDLDAADNLLKVSKEFSDGDSPSALSGDSLRALRQSQRVSQVLQENKAERELQQRKLHTGFVAQDVEKAAQSIGFDFDGVDVDEAGVYGLRYSEFVMPLVKAVQELSRQNDTEHTVVDSLQHRIDQLESLHEITAVAALEHQVEELTGRLNKLDGGTSSFPDANGMFIPNASLEQNFPNPFKHSTTINYSLPQSYRSANIVVTDISGRVFKHQSLHSGPGASHIKIDTGHMSAGVYYYSLYVDNVLVDSKKMIVTK